MKRTILLCISLIPVIILKSQVFTDVTVSQGISFSFEGGEYGGGVSFVDFNKDGWDDLSFCQNESDPVFFQNNAGNFDQVPSFFSNSGQLKDILWVDYDNDGDKDIFATRMFSLWSLYQNDGAMNFTDVTNAAGLMGSTLYMTYGASWSDYDRDGDLDLYVCNYNGPGFPNPTVTNFLFSNDGDGTFTDVTMLAGVSNGSHYSFQGLWLDYDHDLWPDLFVINDRQNCQNYLYHNLGDGTFEDVSAESGLGGYFIFAMNNVADDYDNDGDLDIYVSNNPTGHLLHRNNGDGTFTEVAEEAGVQVDDMGWAAQFFDFDNDTHLDLHVCSSPFWSNPGQNKFFRNNGNGTFENYINEAGFLGDDGWSHSSAIGDFNNDGHFDLVISKDAPDEAKLFRCPLSNNHWMKIGLEGTLSNTEGIGTWIECYAAGKKFVRYTYCGEGYLSQNSQSEIFGLGQASVVDSLVLQWPSGVVDRWYNVAPDQSLLLVEGSSYTASLETDGSTHFCEGEDVVIEIADYASYLWNSGETTASIEVNQAGLHWCTVTTPEGLEITSDTVEVVVYPAPVIGVSAEMVSCNGYSDGSIELTNAGDGGIASVLWNSAELSGNEVYGLSPGIYTYTVIDNFNCSSSGENQITEPQLLEEVLFISHNLCYDAQEGMAEIAVSGGTEPYVINWSEGTFEFLAAGEHSVSVTDAHGCMLTESYTVTEPPALEFVFELMDASFANGLGAASIVVSGGIPPYDVNWSNGDIGGFADDLAEGSYSCTVVDSNGCSHNAFFDIYYNQVSSSEQDIISLYPNPAVHYVYLMDRSNQIKTLALFDLTGRQYAVPYRLLETGEWELDLRALSSGLYLISGEKVDHTRIPFSRLLLLHD